MRMFTFKGGIHPPERKEASRDAAITEAFPSTKQVTVPVTMGGAPNECIVNVGDRVVKGQVIAKSDAYMSVPVHATVTGTVKEIAPHLITGGGNAPCVTIESDGSDETAYMNPLDPFSCDAKTALERIRDAGIVGMGGAAFPTHVKLSPPAGSKIELLILNAAECEPYLTVDYRTLKEDCDKVIDGLAIEMHILGDVKGIVALESNKLDVLDIINSAIAKSPSAKDIEVRVLKTKYPQGGEKNLISALTGREVPSGGLPANVGCVVTNVGTAAAISDAFRLGKPLVERALTISGDALEKAANVRVPLGTNVGDLIPEIVKPNMDETVKIISGGPMMGFAMANAMFPVAKGTSGVLFLTKHEIYLIDESQCIGCGSCIEACPMRLTPVMMARTIKADDYDGSVEFGLLDCIECGSCAYVCPAHVRLVQRFRDGKNVVHAKRTKEAAMLKRREAAKARAAATQGGK